MDNNFPREMKLQWAGSRERISVSGRGGAFFLTSFFIELIDPANRLVFGQNGRTDGASLRYGLI
jgi:hypothetical protein